jgi:hypothetical protein
MAVTGKLADIARGPPAVSLGPAYRLIYGDGAAGTRAACFIAEHLNVPMISSQSPSSSAAADGRKAVCRGEFVPPELSRTVPRLIDQKDAQAMSRAVEALSKLELKDDPSRVFSKSYTPGRLTVVLTQYKRNCTEAQLRALFRQTIVDRIDRIIIFQNENHIDLSFLDAIDFSADVIFGGPDVMSRLRDMIQVIRSPQWNTKYYGRFALPLLFDTEFSAIFDDDTIPQPRYLEVAIALSARKNAIVGPVGVVITPGAPVYMWPASIADIEV